MGAIQARYSESDVLHCLEQSAIVLDEILARGQRGFDRPPMAEQHADIRNLSIIANVLRFLGQYVMPSIFADRSEISLLRWQAAVELLTHISNQARALELHFMVPPAKLN